MKKFKLTLSLLDDESNKGVILAQGVTTNDTRGIFMTDSNIGEKLRWILKVGDARDWTIYCHWASHDAEYVQRFGEKVREKTNIERIIDLESGTWERFRR